MLKKELSYQYIQRNISRERFWEMYLKENVVFEGYLLHLYKNALTTKSADVLFEAIIIGDFFEEESANDTFMDIITACLAGRWHEKHEDLLHYYKGLFREQDIPVLVDLVRFQPEYLEWDEGHQLARKSIYALEKIKTKAAFSAINGLISSENETLSNYAQEVLNRYPNNHDSNIIPN